MGNCLLYEKQGITILVTNCIRMTDGIRLQFVLRMSSQSLDVNIGKSMTR